MDHRELVAAQPGDEGGVVGQRPGHPLRLGAQDGVADVVAVGVVDAPEAVEVDDRHGHAPAGVGGPHERRPQRLAGRRPVVQAGQQVVARLVGELAAQAVQLDQRARQHQGRAFQGTPQLARHGLGQGGVVQVVGGQRLGLGLEQPQVVHQVGHRPERDRHLRGHR